MRILVCGGRDFTNYDLLGRVLDQLAMEYSDYYNIDDNWLPSDFTIIHGGAKGADLLADQWAVVNWLKIEEYKADWGKYGQAAGGIRNQQMLEEGKPDLVVAFPTKNSRGTWDMVRRATKAGVKTIIKED